MKHKVAELSGALLDAAVAKAHGYVEDALQEWEGRRMWVDPTKTIEGWAEHVAWVHEWKPSTDWQHGGPILERERITLHPPKRSRPDAWAAAIWRDDDDSDSRFVAGSGDGPTPLIAAMRAYVASKFGEEVDLP